MKRFLSAGLFLVCLAFAPSLSAAARDEPQPQAAVAIALPAAPAHHGSKAPADEYFGRLKLSILGIRNSVADIDARGESADDVAARNLCHKLIVAEDALRDWQAKYPDDAWIPKLGYAMLKDFEKLDATILTEDFHDASVHAIDLAGWLEATFPNSEFAPK